MNSKGIAGFNTGLVKSVGNGYTPTEWATGDVITAEKLNNIESGIENNESGIDAVKTLYVTVTLTWGGGTPTVTLDKTYDEMLESYNSGAVITHNFYETFAKIGDNFRTEISVHSKSAQSVITQLNLIGITVKPDNTIEVDYSYKGF